ncbi:MAG: ABC transporter substrate-binding protein [Acidobacteriota bacterium]
MRCRRRWFLMAALGILPLWHGACQTAGEPVVGAILPATGTASAYGRSVRDGMDLALEEINAAGGIGGKPLRILYEDSRSDADQGKAVARKLIEKDRVQVLIGAVSSAVTRAILEDVADPAKIVLLSPAASSPNLTGLSSYFFRVYPSDVLEGARMAALASKELRLRRLAVLSVADEYGSGYKRVFIERYRRAKNREVVKVFNYQPGETDFSAQIDALRALAPDGLLLIGYMDPLVAMVRQIRAQGLTMPILTSGSLLDDFASLAGPAGEGVLFCRPSPRIIGNPDKVAAFTKAFAAKYGHEPDDYAPYGYDAVKLLAQVLAQGNLTARDIHVGLRSPAAEYHGVTGNIVFGNEGDVVASPTTYIVKDGALKIYQEYLDEGGAPPGEGAD